MTGGRVISKEFKTIFTTPTQVISQSSMSPMLWLQRSHLLVVPTYVNLAMSRKAHSQSSGLLSVPTIARVRKVPEFERAVPVVSVCLSKSHDRNSQEDYM